MGRNSLIDWKMRSSRNQARDYLTFDTSLIDWKMRSSRNATLTGSYDPASLIDWKMRSSRNSVTTDLISTLKFNRLENAL